MSERQRIEETAARWLIRREEPDWDATAQDELDHWLDASLAHKAAFWRLESGWRAADRVAAVAYAPQRRSVRHRVAALANGRLRWAVPAALAATVAGIMLLPTWLSTDQADLLVYRTAVGQAREITTADGSRIELNTATELRTRVVTASRDVWLDRGEAFFDIRHKERHPFRVHAGSKTITVLGTRFSVRRDGDRVTVAVLSGRVRIDDSAPQAAARSATVAEGDMAIAAGSSTLIAANVEPRIQAMTAWRDGMIVFDQTPLADAAAELNRYTANRIVIDDRSLAQFRIGGSFRLDNSKGFLRLLESAYGLNVTQKGEEMHVSKAIDAQDSFEPNE